MKGSRSNPAKSASSSAVDTLIGRQTEILSGVLFARILHVDGRIKGGVSTETDKSSALWASESGTIEGNVTVPISSLTAPWREMFMPVNA